MTKICTSCGTQAEEDKSFCSVCGARLDCKANSEQKSCEQKRTPLCKKSKTALWIVALIAQFLCVLMFFLPTVRVTVTVPGEYADKIPTVSNFLKGDKAKDNEAASIFDKSKEEESEQTSKDIDVLEGDFKLMNVIDFFGTEAYQILCLFGVVVSFALFVAPLARKRELKVQNALFALVTQAMFFVVNIITLLVLKGKPVSTIRKFADMVIFADIPEFIVDWLCKTIESFYRYEFNIWGWLYIAFSILCIAILSKLVIDNRKELKRS